ncbi:Hypothetical predicted protein [Lynx pardinus]|uniref:Ig-like domain-containing protein n=1 Tax=Lynx pardinus TaxID=191816 RepID=A0A485MFN4_LYNPA|nr:Hypothetical predicted protein [Lynx pardinus]
MSPALQLALLGATLVLPRAQALTCQWATREFLINVSEMPFQWKVGHEVCANGWGCQDTLILIDNGLQVNIVLTKGCTPVGNQDARITEHRAGPGLSILSYTHVCRHEDNCNNLSTTLPLWALPSTAGPGSLRCPVCLSKRDCESATKVTCPAGSTHCYRGSIQLRGGGVFTVLRVQGCMSQDGCNVLNGTREIGSIVVSEDCSPNAFLTCEWGSELLTGRNLSQMPIRWTATHKICDPGEVCEETLLLVEAGQSSVIAGSKGCTKGRTQDAPTVSIHSGPPGVLVASYAHFCSSDRCNRARSTSVLLNSLPRPGYGWFKGTTIDPHREIVSYAPDSQEINPGYAHSGRETLYLNGSLLFQNINLKDTGYYTLQIIKRNVQVERVTGQLRVYQQVLQPTVHASNTTATEHKDSVVLTCSTNNKKVSIRWFFNGRSINLTKRMKLSRDNRALTISLVRVEDAGNYQCEVSNRASSNRSDPIRLAVSYGRSPMGLPVGTSVGIAIGVLVGVALVAALGYLLLRVKAGRASGQRNHREMGRPAFTPGHGPVSSSTSPVSPPPPHWGLGCAGARQRTNEFSSTAHTLLPPE